MSPVTVTSTVPNLFFDLIKKVIVGNGKQSVLVPK